MTAEQLTIGPDEQVAAGVAAVVTTAGLHVLHLSIGPLQLELVDLASVQQLAAVVDVALDLASQRWQRCTRCLHRDAIVADGYHPTCREAERARLSVQPCSV